MKLWVLLPLAVSAIVPTYLLKGPGAIRNSHLELLTHKRSILDDYPYLQVANFTQTLDHFNTSDTRTWNQKYFYNPKYTRNNSIIFLMIGGEGPENGKWAAKPDIQYLKWADEFGADVFDLEHRFFGDSWPLPNMDTESLRYLTTEQALADLASFIKAMNTKYNFTNPRWVTFGGSYPGSMSAWFREKYPELTVGAVASSAPLNLKLDFYEYAMVVQDDLTIYSQECADNVRDGWSKIQNFSLTEEGRDSLNDIFNIQPKFDNSTTKLDITNFFANLYNAFQGMTQYTYDNQSEQTHYNQTVQKMCEIMTDKSETDNIKRVRNMYLWTNAMMPISDDVKVMPNNYNDVIAKIGSGNLTVLGEDGAASRGWMWLCCNEIGFLQTTDQGNNVFGSTVPLNYFIDMCTDMFGDTVKMDQIRENNAAAQKFYGGITNYNATNIVLPNGSQDPWHALGLYTDNARNNLTTILINGTAHCADMYPTYDKEPSALAAARDIIKANVRNFIQYDENRDGPTSLSSETRFFMGVLVIFIVSLIL